MPAVTATAVIKICRRSGAIQTSIAGEEDDDSDLAKGICSSIRNVSPTTEISRRRYAQRDGNPTTQVVDGRGH
jgi:hypothetical protein